MSNTGRTKISQSDLRRLMVKHQNKAPIPKIDNPLAKYNDAGILTCILCKSVVRSEAVWSVHINSYQHKDNVAAAKRLKEQTNNFTKVTKAPKRSAMPPLLTTEPKKIKGILKNAPSKSIPDDFFQNPKSLYADPNIASHNEEIKRAPLKQFPAKVKDEIEQLQPSASLKEDKNKDEAPQTSDQPLPEGFFDDPVLDAKARNIEYKDPIEEEWERFQREMREEASAAATLAAGEQEQAATERHISEIDEQMRNWSRVLDLELKKEETTKTKHEVGDTDMADESSSASDAEGDEFLDWRAKKSFR